MPVTETPKLKAILSGRCPVCRQGAVFTGPWHRLNFLDTYKNCSVCNVQFEAEPGFFIGAMYVNYGFNVATLAAIGLFTWLVFNPESPWVYVAAVIGVTIAAIPFTSRLSRMIWIYMFGPFKYDPSFGNKASE